MSLQIPTPIFREPGFDPTTGLPEDHAATEGPEPPENLPADVLTDVEGGLFSTEGWLLLTCSTFGGIQLETVVLRQQGGLRRLSHDHQSGTAVCNER